MAEQMVVLKADLTVAWWVASKEVTKAVVKALWMVVLLVVWMVVTRGVHSVESKVVKKAVSWVGQKDALLAEYSAARSAVCLAA